MTPVLIYAIFADNYQSAEKAAKARDGVYVGKTNIDTKETTSQALSRVLTEHEYGNGRNGQLLESYLERRACRGQFLETAQLSMNNQSPTPPEKKWIDRFLSIGADILNERI